MRYGGNTTSNPRSAMTLVELLVVIVLITTLVSTAIPIISPGGDARKLREASRNLNAYLQGAQARAMETGRPFGVSFVRLSEETERFEDNAVCVRAEYVEVPPEFSGFSDTSMVRIARSTQYAPTAVADDRGPFWLQFLTRGVGGANLPPGWVADPLVPPRFLRPGDTVEVRGQRYTLLEEVSTATVGTADVQASVNDYFPGSGTGGQLVTLLAKPEGAADGLPFAQMPQVLPRYDDAGAAITAASDASRPFWTEPAPYKIHRQPVPAGGEPLELPSGVAVDLQASVFGNGTRVYSPHVDFNSLVSPTVENVRTAPLMVLFSPEGPINRVHGLVDATLSANYAQAISPATPATSYLALCVGRRELIPGDPRVAPPTTAAYLKPIDLKIDVIDAGLDEDDARELMDGYNWLNLESRWVVIGSQSGSVITVENSSFFPAEAENGADTSTIDLGEQLAAALENAPRRLAAGGR